MEDIMVGMFVPESPNNRHQCIFKTEEDAIEGIKHFAGVANKWIVTFNQPVIVCAISRDGDQVDRLMKIVEEHKTRKVYPDLSKNHFPVTLDVIEGESIVFERDNYANEEEVTIAACFLSELLEVKHDDPKSRLNIISEDKELVSRIREAVNKDILEFRARMKEAS